MKKITELSALLWFWLKYPKCFALSTDARRVVIVFGHIKALNTIKLSLKSSNLSWRYNSLKSPQRSCFVWWFSQINRVSKAPSTRVRIFQNPQFSSDEFAWETATFWIRSLEWKFVNPRTIWHRVDGHLDWRKHKSHKLLTLALTLCWEIPQKTTLFISFRKFSPSPSST